MDFLWQRPKKKVKISDPVWYDNAPVGRDPLNNVMKNLSLNANLSKVYKKHSICATVMTNLDNKGFETHYIMAMTGHKSQISIKNYSRKCPSNKQKQIFDALVEDLVQNNDNFMPKKPKIENDSTLTSPQQNEPNFDLALAELDTINKNDLSNIFDIDNDIESPDLLNIMKKKITRTVKM